MVCTEKNGGGGGGYSPQTSAQNSAYDNKFGLSSPEQLLADQMKADLGVIVNPQALRMWLRWRWDRITPIAHRIHNA